LIDDRKEFGSDIEKLAARYLEESGYEILERNFRVGHKEIDIIAREKSTVVFVEVKASRNLSYGHPSFRVTRKQRMNIIMAARHFIEDRMLEGYDFRLDVISFYPVRGGGYTLDHIKGAFME
jgi:putative endonuclease